MPSLLNGLSAMGAGVAQFASSAGLEQQKADLASQQAVLADQLQTTRETAGRAQAGDIAAAAAGKEQEFQAGQGALNRASTQSIAQLTADTSIKTTGMTTAAGLQEAGIQAASQKYAADTQSKDVYAQIASSEPEQQARILAQNQQTALVAVQTQNAQALQQAHDALQAETAKPSPDPAKISALQNQVTSLETSASTQAAVTQAAAGMYRTDMDAVTHFNTQLTTATAALNNPEMSDTDRTAQKGLISDLKLQLQGAQRALQYSSDLVHGRVGAANGSPPPGVAPTPPAGVPPGARFSPTLKIWQSPDGQLFDAQGKPTTAPGAAAPPPAAGGGLINGAGAGP